MPTITLAYETDESLNYVLHGGASDPEDAVDTADGSKYVELPGPGSPRRVQFADAVTMPTGAVVYGWAVTALCASEGPSGTAEIGLADPPELADDDNHSVTELTGFVSKVTTRTGLAVALSGAQTFRFYARQVVAEVLVDYLAATVSYNIAPGAPDNLAPIEGAVTTTLNPTFTGNHNDADGDSTMEAVEIEVRRVSNNALMWASGMIADTGSTFSQGYGGSPLSDGVQYKWRARTRDNTGASNDVGAWSSYITFTANTNDAPTALQTSPVADAQVGTLTPSFVIGFSDPDVGDQFNAYQIQVRRNSDQVSFWDSGQVATTAPQKAAGSATVVYAGTTLVNGTEYEWRVRVQDLFSTWSSYSSWRDFTPALAPDPPTGLTPTGLQNTLTPTVSGTYVQATGGTETDFQYQVRQSGITIYSSGDVAADIATGQAYGTNNPSDTPSTPPALAWGTAYQIRARSKDNAAAYSDWTSWQDFSTNVAPNTPTGITPGEGQITPDTTPTVTWVHNDPDADAQTQADIELYDVTDDAFVTGYDPKTLTQATLTHDVTETLDLNHQYQLRIRTKGLAGPGFGPYSSPILFTVATAPVVTVDEPDPDDVVTSSSVTVEWTMTGGSGTQASYRVRLYDEDGTTVLHDSGVTAGVDDSYVIPAGTVRNGGDYFVQVLLVDTLAQAGASALIPFSASFTPPATVTGLATSVVGDNT